jgi:hypothetical protein
VEVIGADASKCVLYVQLLFERRGMALRSLFVGFANEESILMNFSPVDDNSIAPTVNRGAKSFVFNVSKAATGQQK